jgi:hypothetical protein
MDAPITARACLRVASSSRQMQRSLDLSEPGLGERLALETALAAAAVRLTRERQLLQPMRSAPVR